MDHAEQRRIDAGNSIHLKWLRSFVVVVEKSSFALALPSLTSTIMLVWSW